MWVVRKHRRANGDRVSTEAYRVEVVHYRRYAPRKGIVGLLLSAAALTGIASWPGWSEDWGLVMKALLGAACAGWVLIVCRSMRCLTRYVDQRWTVPEQWHDLPVSVLIQAAEAGAGVEWLEKSRGRLKRGGSVLNGAALALPNGDGRAVLCRSIDDQLDRAREDLIVAVESARLDIELGEENEE